MTGSAFKRWTLYGFPEVKERGSGGERARHRLGSTGWRMTGSALKRWTLCRGSGGLEIERGSGGEIVPPLPLARGWRIYVEGLWARACVWGAGVLELFRVQNLDKK